ncbi:hypothetical protein WICPIJ_003221 [Wickerhamomyces pijperi]|uniref:BED-type domain-containing protein n=1 Tax=Wickerhamomyces pijperi TaxID=599730 RepID=A0A9P8Q7Q8_WICPI|nr:hypothetical protein WICPIJ_003221 [Wickerhamomyces pijperi]
MASENFTETFMAQALNTRYDDEHEHEHDQGEVQESSVEQELLNNIQQHRTRTSSNTAATRDHEDAISAVAAAAQAVAQAAGLNVVHDQHDDEQSVAAAAVQSLNSIGSSVDVDMAQSNAQDVVDSVVKAATAVAGLSNDGQTGTVHANTHSKSTTNELPEGLRAPPTQRNSSGSTTNSTHNHPHPRAQAISQPRAPRVNRPGQKFGAKRRSWVWEWFIQDPTDYNIATCEVCGKCVVRLSSDKGSPKKLAEHLRTHKIERGGPQQHAQQQAQAQQAQIQQQQQQQQQIPQPNASFYQGTGSANGVHSNNTTVTSSAGSAAIPNNSSISTLEAQQTNFSAGQNGTTAASVTATTTNAAGNTNTVHTEKVKQPRKRQAKKTTLKVPVPAKSSTLTHQLPTTYNSLRFQKNILQFVLENKLTLATIKTESFKDLVMGLNPQAVKDLEELNGLYPSLIEVLSGKTIAVDEESTSKPQQEQAQAQTDQEDQNVVTEDEEEEGLADVEKDLDPELLAHQTQTQTETQTENGKTSSAQVDLSIDDDQEMVDVNMDQSEHEVEQEATN